MNAITIATSAQLERGPIRCRMGPHSPWAPFVAGRLPVEPGAARRAVLVTLQTLLPYCLQQWSQPHASAQRASEEAWPPRDACSDNAASTQDPLPHERAWNKV